MPHYLPNEYPNIFGCPIFTKQISEYICMPEIARIRIQIIFEGNFILIFKYSYSTLIEEGINHVSSKLNGILDIFLCINYI